MNNKIVSLTKVFLKDFIQNSKILKKGRKIAKSNFFWMLVILAIAVTWFSIKLIKVFSSAGQPMMFLHLYFMVFTMVLIFQIILTATNTLFFSKDTEIVMSFPILPVQILISKYLVILVTTYVTEALFTLIPMILYGMLVKVSMLYFIIMPITLLIYPVLLVLVISIISILFMGIFKFIKNRNIYQVIVTMLLIIMALSLEMNAVNKFSNVREDEISQEVMYEVYSSMEKNFLIITPTVNILGKSNEFGTVFSEFGKLIGYNIVGMMVFLLVGKKRYLKNLLSGTNSKTLKSKYHKDEKINKKIVNRGVRKSYIIKEFKGVFGNSTIFMHSVFPVIILLISAIIVGSTIIPSIDRTIQSDETIKNALASISFDTTAVCIILCILQVLFSMSRISLIAISRERESALFVKYVPIDLYRQFLYKNVPQVVLNLMVSIIILGMIYYLMSGISMGQILILFVISIFMNLINSFLMLVVDLKRPQFKWDSEYEITKGNSNQIYQYVFMIIMILTCLYFSKILKEMNINLALSIQLILFIIAFVVINAFIKKNIKKIFSKIN